MAEKEAKERTESKESSVSRWDPFAELTHWKPRGWGFPRSLVDLFDEAFQDWPATAREFRPAIDVHEDEKSYVVTVELAGAKRDDVNVELKDNVLTIRGEKKSQREEKKEQARYVERRFGSFSRSFTLPSDAVADKISAAFEDGVLTLTIPKSEETKPRTIAIKS